MTSLFVLAAGFLGGLIGSYLVSHPGSKVRVKFPKIKIWKLVVWPNLKLEGTTRELHIHHWIYYGVALMLLFKIGETMSQYLFAKSFLSAITIHGLSYKDRLQFFRRKES